MSEPLLFIVALVGLLLLLGIGNEISGVRSDLRRVADTLEHFVYDDDEEDVKE